MLECNRLHRGIELCEPDSGPRNHRYSAMILVEDVVGCRPRPNGTSALQHLQTSRAQATKRNVVCIFMLRLSEAKDIQSCVMPALPDDVHLIGKRVDVKRSTPKLTSLHFSPPT